ncbi:MAG: hypothetical protein KDD01_01700 [Phaeodactylibacter sp.]|nr:hypothetical protein [Phaeodactylibacter sp.]
MKLLQVAFAAQRLASQHGLRCLLLAVSLYMPSSLPAQNNWLLQDTKAIQDSLIVKGKEDDAASLTSGNEVEGAEQGQALLLLEKDKEINRLKQYNYTICSYAVIGLFILLAVIVGLLFINNRQKAGAGQSLSEQNLALQEAKEELRQNLDKLEASSENLNNFIFAASHDLKESVRSMTSFGQLLERKLLAGQTDTASYYAGFIVENGMRMNQTLEKLLFFSELALKEQSSNTLVDLHQVACRAWDEVLQGRNPDSCTLNLGPLPHASGYPVLLYQLVSFLFENAIDFRREKQHLTVELNYQENSQTGSSAFVLKDNGPGVGPEYLESIFEPFKRLNPRGKGGAGLGLSICRRIVELHQGAIWAEPSEQGGLAVYFTLPVMKMQVAEPAIS